MMILAIKLEKYLDLADFTAFWKLARQSLSISYEMCNLSFFHFRSALLQACLRERMLSLSHGSVLGFDFLGLRGAVVFKTSEQAELNRLRCCSASKSGKNDSRERDRHKSPSRRILLYFMQSPTKAVNSLIKSLTRWGGRYTSANKTGSFYSSRNNCTSKLL